MNLEIVQGDTGRWGIRCRDGSAKRRLRGRANNVKMAREVVDLFLCLLRIHNVFLDSTQFIITLFQIVRSDV
jgi:hypothetical protein